MLERSLETEMTERLERILPLYACGMSVRDICSHLVGVYGVKGGPGGPG